MPLLERKAIVGQHKNPVETLSPWWRHAVILVMVLGFTILIWLAVRTYTDAPPIPEKVMSPSGEPIFTREDILGGQQVFLRYGLMENGTIWRHGAYLGPDFSAEYLHTQVTDAGEMMANQRFGRSLGELTAAEGNAINVEIQQLLKQNRYDPQTKTLTFTETEVHPSIHSLLAQNWRPKATLNT